MWPLVLPKSKWQRFQPANAGRPWGPIRGHRSSTLKITKLLFLVRLQEEWTCLLLNAGTNSAEIPYGSKILSKSLYLARFSRYKHFCVLQFLWKNGKFKMARQIFFENWDGYSAEIPCGLQILSKSLYLARFSRYKHFCVLQFLRKIRNKIFLKTGMATMKRYPAGQKFRCNRSI